MGPNCCNDRALTPGHFRPREATAGDKREVWGTSEDIRTLGTLGRLPWESEHCGPSNRVAAPYPVGCPHTGCHSCVGDAKSTSQTCGGPPQIWDVETPPQLVGSV